MPDDAQHHPVPCILEYIPYRKRDMTSLRDEGMHKYFASKGYGCIRVDMRGAGDSEGVLMDEYLPREQQDGVEAIAWIADQPWCDGNVGMIGISWGGITQLQIATLKPQALKAIVPVGASIDRYYDDGGYFIGAYSGETIGWGGLMFAINTFPPDPAVVGEENCEAMWLKRLETMPLFLSTWLNHPARDDYWLQGTVIDCFKDITCPIFVVSGWNDCWPNTVLRVIQRAETPVWGLSGVWGHMYPHQAFPGPGVNFLDEVIRFWDKYLKNQDNGYEQTAPLTVFVQTQVPTDPAHTNRPGYWVAEPAWPSPNVTTETWCFGRGQLAPQPIGGGIDSICSAVSTGFCSRDYMPVPPIPELEQMPTEQSPDDAESLVYDSPKIDSSMVIMGTPTAHLRIKSDHNSGLVALRLCDVAPNGEVSQITYGVLNLAQRDGREKFVTVKADTYYDIMVRLNDIAHEIQPGHQLRLSVSSNYFPMAWPLPYRCTLTLDSTASRLSLPVRHRPEVELPVAESYRKPPQVAEPDLREEIAPAEHSKHIERTASQTSMYIRSSGGLSCHPTTGWTYGKDSEECFSVDNDDPLKTTAVYDTTAQFIRDGFDARTVNKMTVSCDETDFIITAKTTVYLNDRIFFQRAYNHRIERHIF